MHNLPGLVMTLTVAALCFTENAVAQTNPYRFELTPYGAYRIGGEFSEEDGDGEFQLKDTNAKGIILNGAVASNTQWELLYARQETQVDTQGLLVGDSLFDIDVEYFQVGGTYLFDGVNTRPFIAMTLGLSNFDPRMSEFESEKFFSASLGGGIQLNANKRLGIRLEGRAYVTLVDDSSTIFCGSNGGVGGCLIHVEGTTFTQWEARAGLVFRF